MMTGDLAQRLVSILVVAGAALYLARRMWNRWRAYTLASRRAKGCGPNCGCE